MILPTRLVERKVRKMTKMVKIVGNNGYVYGEVTEAEYAEATSINEMAFQIYVDFRLGMTTGENSHEDAMKEMKDWDAMMRGEIPIEEYEKPRMV